MTSARGASHRQGEQRARGTDGRGLTSLAMANNGRWRRVFSKSVGEGWGCGGFTIGRSGNLVMEDEVFWGSRWLGSLPLFDERGPRRVTAVDPERKTQQLHPAALNLHRWAASCLIHSLRAGNGIQKGLKLRRHQPPCRRCGFAHH